MPEDVLTQGQGASPESMIVTPGSTPAPAGGEPSATPAPAANAQPQAPAFNPTEWNLSYRGRPIAVRDRQHLVSLATKGYGFDQEIDRIKQRETELNEMGTKYQRYGKLEEAFSQNPALAQKVFELVQNPQAAGGEGQDEEPPYVTEMRRELQEIKAWREQLNNRNADQELQAEMDALKKANPQHDWDFVDDTGKNLSQKIFAHAHNNGKMFPSLMAAYRDYFWDNRDATVRADTLKAEQERLARDKAAGKVGTGGPTPAAPQKPGYTPDKSYNDLANMAATRLS